MACTWASKVNGILTVIAIGIPVMVDLWDILDIKKGHSMVCFDVLCLSGFLLDPQRNTSRNIFSQELWD